MEGDAEGIAGNEFYAGVRYILDNGLGFGAGYNHISLDGKLENRNEAKEPGYINKGESIYNGEIELSGPYIEMVYKLKDMITLKGAVIFNDLLVSYDTYDYKYEYDEETDYEDEDTDSFKTDYLKGDGMGYKIGAELEYPFTESLSFTAMIPYNFGDLDITHMMNYDTEKWIEVPEGGSASADYSGYSFGFGVNFAF